MRQEGLPWTEAARAGDSEERRAFLESHLDLVRYLVLRIASRLPATVEIEDLTHDGVLGLLEAARNFDPARGARFRTYAEARIRGAILDGLRARDWKPRSVHRGRRALDEALGRLRATRGADAPEEEIAAALGIGIEDYRALLRDVSCGPLLSLEDLPGGGEPPAEGEEGRPDRAAERRELLRVLAEELERLPERERRVVELYYHGGLNMKEVGAVLGVTESRVCQLHAQAAARLRAGLRARLHVAAPATASPGAHDRRRSP